MDAISTFTTKGLVYIPKDSLKKAGFSPRAQVSVRAKKGKIVLEEIPSIESMFGFLHTPGLNEGKTLEEILDQEERAIEAGFSEDYLKSISED